MDEKVCIIYHVTILSLNKGMLNKYQIKGVVSPLKSFLSDGLRVVTLLMKERERSMGTGKKPGLILLICGIQKSAKNYRM